MRRTYIGLCLLAASPHVLASAGLAYAVRSFIHSQKYRLELRVLNAQTY